jgi:hypothetical protein
MTVLFYDCFSGISGDMNLGAMVDLGVDPEYLKSELKKLHLDSFRVEFKTEQRKGITGTRAHVLILDEKGMPGIEPDTQDVHDLRDTQDGHDLRDASDSHGSHSQHDSQDAHHTQVQDYPHSSQDVHNNHHSHGERGKSESHHHTGQRGKSESHHPQRNLHDIQEIIQQSSLNDFVKAKSLDIFQKVAEAEAKIHNKSIEEIHFHEVGAIDSIVDIVGAAICIDYLKPDRIISSSVEVGGGFVTCEHGTFPIPAPATAEILKNIPVKSGAVQSETTTPTGAAILATMVNEFTDKIQFTIHKTGYGIGSKDFDIPNVLRVHLGELSGEQASGEEVHTAYLVECNIDDMNPEMYGHIMDLLFEKGADDVFITPIIMKKARPASKLSVLCRPEIDNEITDILLTHTTSLGVRKHKVEKMVLKREFQKIMTRYGQVTIKTAIYKGKKLKSKPEYEDCIRIAKENNVPVHAVYQEINKLIASLNSDAD